MDRGMKITIPGAPRTKKNSSQIIMIRSKPILIPSAQFRKYQTECGKHLIDYKYKMFDYPMNVQLVYYMDTKRKVDLGNLIAATCDILTHYKVIADDNSNIVVSHDGSRVLYDKFNPRVEITITEVI